MTADGPTQFPSTVYLGSRYLYSSSVNEEGKEGFRVALKSLMIELDVWIRYTAATYTCVCIYVYI